MTITEDAKEIYEAKSLLMSAKGLTEPQAHRYIEKRAMDTRTKKAAVAKQIITAHAKGWL